MRGNLQATDGASKPEVRRFQVEMVGLIGLGALVTFFVVTSWRKWADPLVDLGVQLNAAWRISHGAVLYRDIDYLYGPLSPYFNATLFRCFGPSIMVLVAANLVVFAGISTALYILCRMAWGAGAALAAGSVFIAVFGFSQFVTTGNYNYATPYANESTHGLLVSLVLALALLRWMEKPSLGLSFAVGILFGLTFVLKPEIILAAGLSLGMSVFAAYRLGNRPSLLAWLLLLLGTILPTALFFIYFSFAMPWPAALDSATRAWSILIGSTPYGANLQQQKFLGFDQIGLHLEEHALATFYACLSFGFIGAVARLSERGARRWWQDLGIGSMAALLLWLATEKIHWIDSGRALTGLVALYLFICLLGFFGKWPQENNRRRNMARLLMALLAIAFLARMILNARLYQFGYYQAALAALMVPAVLIGEMPQWLGAGRRGTFVVVLGTLCLFLPGVIILTGTSQQILASKSVVVGRGGDLLYAFPPNIDPTGEIVNRVIAGLRVARPDDKLLVLPQGLMINYLTRMPGPSAPAGYAHTAEQESQTVTDLEESAPRFVVLISQDLRWFGIARYGNKANEGGQILDWLARHYTKISVIGGDPLDDTQHGAVVFQRIAEP